MNSNQQLLDANNHYLNNEIDEAKKLYLSILEECPSNGDALHNLGMIFFLNRDNKKQSLKLFQKALETNPTNTQYVKSYLIALLADNQIKTALSILTNAEANEVPEGFINSLIDMILIHKIDDQGGIPTFFDNFIMGQMKTGQPTSAKAYAGFRSLLNSKEDRFGNFEKRSKENCVLSGKSRTSRISVSLSQGTHSTLTWKTHEVFKSAFDLIIYSMLIAELKPDVIIELGSGKGGSAIWLADMAKILGLESKVYSYDINKPNINYPRVTFHEFDLKTLSNRVEFPENQRWTGVKLVIEDAHVNLATVFDKIDGRLCTGDYFIVEDSDFKQTELASFLIRSKNSYLPDQYYLDLFGRNGTSATNSIFKVK